MILNYHYDTYCIINEVKHETETLAQWIIPMAFGNGLGQTTQQSLLSRFAPPTMRGQLLSILAATNSLALIAGPLLAGLLLNISPAAPNLMAASLTAVAFIISLPILRLSTPAEDGPVSLSQALAVGD
jgi:MFS family permease